MQCVAFSPNGQQLAFGLDASKSSRLKVGAVFVFCLEERVLVSKHDAAGERVTCIAWSPNGARVCFADDHSGNAAHVCEVAGERSVVQVGFGGTGDERETESKREKDSSLCNLFDLTISTCGCTRS